MPLPYSSSTAGQAREKEIRDTLRSVGATAVGFMVDDDADQIIAQFRLHEREGDCHPASLKIVPADQSS